MYINRQIRFVGDAQRQQQTDAHGLHHLSRLTAGQLFRQKLLVQIIKLTATGWLTARSLKGVDSMYDIDIYMDGKVAISYKNMNYDTAREVFINANQSYQNYPQLYVDGVPYKIKDALKHFKYNQRDIGFIIERG